LEPLPYSLHNQQGIEKFLSIHAKQIAGSHVRPGATGDDKHGDLNDARLTAPNPYGEVVELTNANYKEKLAEGVWFVDFFAPWCPHCVHLKPTWLLLAQQSKNVMNIATIDCTQQGEACNAYGIRGFPTLKLLKNGKAEDYWGSRDLDGLTRFVQEHAQ
jgi:protein disulfide-isomerase-like protein